MKLIHYAVSCLPIALFVPFVAHAQTTLFDIIDVFLNLIDQLILVILALALLFFLWGVARFILKADNEAEREKGKKVMIWGLIALFVMVSVWGIVALFQETLGVEGDEPPDWYNFSQKGFTEDR